MDITIHLTEIEVKALRSVIVDVQEWSSYIIKDRARIEIDRILEQYLKNCLENNIPLPSGTKDEIIMSIPIMSAFEKNLINEGNI